MSIQTLNQRTASGRRDDASVFYSADGVARVYVSILLHYPGVYLLISDDLGDIFSTPVV